MVDQAAADEVDIADSWGASHAMRTAFKQKIALFRQKRQFEALRVLIPCLRAECRYHPALGLIRGLVYGGCSDGGWAGGGDGENLDEGGSSGGGSFQGAHGGLVLTPGGRVQIDRNAAGNDHWGVVAEVQIAVMR